MVVTALHHCDDAIVSRVESDYLRVLLRNNYINRSAGRAARLGVGVVCIDCKDLKVL